MRRSEMLLVALILAGVTACSGVASSPTPVGRATVLLDVIYEQ